LAAVLLNWHINNFNLTFYKFLPYIFTEMETLKFSSRTVICKSGPIEEQV
jgi:hypothetical protein